MPKCYYCKENKSFYTRFPSKICKERICVDCLKELGFKKFFSFEERMDAFKGNFSNVDEVINLLKERKVYYDNIENIFKPTKEFIVGEETKCIDGHIGLEATNRYKIEVDEGNKLIKVTIIYHYAHGINQGEYNLFLCSEIKSLKKPEIKMTEDKGRDNKQNPTVYEVVFNRFDEEDFRYVFSVHDKELVSFLENFNV